MTKPDLILVTESWCNNSVSNEFLSIDGYELQTDLRSDRNDTAQGRGGGLLVYSKNGLKVTKIECNVTFNQYCCFTISDITIYLVYRSPNATVEAMAGLIDLMKSVRKNTIVIGDFNLPDINWSTGEAAKRSETFLEAVEDAMLVQLVEFPTHIKGNCLDLVLSNIPERVTEVSGAGRLGSSDHEMLEILVQTGTYREVKKTVKNWRRADWNKMREEIGAVDWHTELRGLTADRMWEKFKKKISKTVKKNVPTRLVSSRGRPVWMSSEIMAAIKRKKRLWRRDRGRGISEEYKEMEKSVKNMIRNAKRKYEKKLADTKSGNNRQFYAYVKRKTKSRPTIGPLKDKNKKIITDDGEMAGLLNEFFSSVFTREDGAVPDAADMDTDNLENISFTAWKVRKKIQKLRPAAAAGPDEIGPRLLQELEQEVAEGLTLIYRKSMESGTVPMDWRCANVTPIFKKGARSEPGNYRPVSLTSVCCKIMESVIRDGMMEHLERNKLIGNSQHGFLPGKSCSTNLLEFLERVTREVDEGKPFDIVFLDFAKAFDKVPKNRLLEKLSAHGVRGDVLRWIKNWLSGRRQRVVLNGKKSSWNDVLSGVPQGSVLGPILFLIFINDLDMETPMVEIVRKFADDTKVGNGAKTMKEREDLQEALDKLSSWADRWGMEFNVSKCKVMHVGHNNEKHAYTMKGQQLTETEEERDIGVMVSRQLKPSVQCKHAARTAQTVLGQLTRAFHYRDRHVFLRLYIQYVRPHLEFCVPAWSPWLDGDKDCLERVQKRAVGMISGLRGRTYEDRLKELGIVTLEERRHQMDMLQTYKILNGKEKVDPSWWFTMASDSERVTRQSADPLNIRPGTPRLDIRRYFYSQRIVESWNNVPLDIKKSVSVTAFKNAYRRHRDDMIAPA